MTAVLSKNITDAFTKSEDTSESIVKEITDSIQLDLSTNEEGVPASILFIKDYLPKGKADELYQELVEKIKWQQREGWNAYGVKYPEPRLTFWYGKPYKYSTVTWEENNDWIDCLKNLRNELNKQHKISDDPKRDYNSVMCNYYQNNKHSIGWHADDETSLGRYPTIASISLGSTRFFDVCKRDEYSTRNDKPNLKNPAFPGCTIMYRFHLNNGSLLLMKGSVQDDWMHRVQKENTSMGGRINLTFRHIVDKEEEVQEIEYKKKLRQSIRKKKLKETLKINEDKKVNDNLTPSDTKASKRPLKVVKESDDGESPKKVSKSKWGWKDE